MARIRTGHGLLWREENVRDRPWELGFRGEERDRCRLNRVGFVVHVQHDAKDKRCSYVREPA